MDRLGVEARIAALEERLGIPLPRRDVALSALTHKSYSNEHREEGLADNERLEFLGDAVVDLAISHRLMEQFPTAREGELSKLRALIVNEDGLARVARSIRLGDLMLLGRGEELTGGRDKSSVLADALEAVIGAIYQCHGFDAVLFWVTRAFADCLAGVAEGRNGADYKTRLQEQAQLKLRVPPRYRVISQSGPEHEKTFEVEVTLGADLTAQGSGRSKKEAEQAAARGALEQLASRDPQP